MPPQTSAVAIQTGYCDDTKVYFSESNKKKLNLFCRICTSAIQTLMVQSVRGGGLRFFSGIYVSLKIIFGPKEGRVIFWYIYKSLSKKEQSGSLKNRTAAIKLRLMRVISIKKVLKSYFKKRYRAYFFTRERFITDIRETEK